MNGGTLFMKKGKLVCLLLILVMIFSFATIAFTACDKTPPDPPVEPWLPNIVAANLPAPGDMPALPGGRRSAGQSWWTGNTFNGAPGLYRHRDRTANSFNNVMASISSAMMNSVDFNMGNTFAVDLDFSIFIADVGNYRFTIRGDFAIGVNSIDTDSTRFVVALADDSGEIFRVSYYDNRLFVRAGDTTALIREANISNLFSHILYGGALDTHNGHVFVGSIQLPIDGMELDIESLLSLVFNIVLFGLGPDNMQDPGTYWIDFQGSQRQHQTTNFTLDLAGLSDLLPEVLGLLETLGIDLGDDLANTVDDLLENIPDWSGRVQIMTEGDPSTWVVDNDMQIPVGNRFTGINVFCHERSFAFVTNSFSIRDASGATTANPNIGRIGWEAGENFEQRATPLPYDYATFTGNSGNAGDGLALLSLDLRGEIAVEMPANATRNFEYSLTTNVDILLLALHDLDFSNPIFGTLNNFIHLNLSERINPTTAHSVVDVLWNPSRSFNPGAFTVQIDLGRITNAATRTDLASILGGQATAPQGTNWLQILQRTIAFDVCVFSLAHPKTSFPGGAIIEDSALGLSTAELAAIVEFIDIGGLLDGVMALINELFSGGAFDFGTLTTGVADILDGLDLGVPANIIALLNAISGTPETGLKVGMPAILALLSDISLYGTNPEISLNSIINAVFPAATAINLSVTDINFFGWAQERIDATQERLGTIINATDRITNITFADGTGANTFQFYNVNKVRINNITLANANQIHYVRANVYVHGSNTPQDVLLQVTGVHFANGWGTGNRNVRLFFDMPEQVVPGTFINVLGHITPLELTSFSAEGVIVVG
jgi:hypothetical protein